MDWEKRPPMTAKVFDCVLPLSERMIGRWLQDPCTALPGMLIMSIYVFDFYMYVVADLVRARRPELCTVR